jgi:hypothetical protein
MPNEKLVLKSSVANNLLDSAAPLSLLQLVLLLTGLQVELMPIRRIIHYYLEAVSLFPLHLKKLRFRTRWQVLADLLLLLGGEDF